MLKNEMREVGKLESAEVKASETAAPRAYATPRLVVLGRAFKLVQGSDLYKDFQDPNGFFRD
ncbi:MAG TPA: hypothetical protein VMS17_16990 [Gemmataceae bacterium]|nr:hypothetical protein [Gemmataceae bacterium]